LREEGEEKEEEQQTTQPAAVLDNGPEIAPLAQEGASLKETVNILISQIQMLRSEVKNKK
jgi:hypothetical protein